MKHRPPLNTLRAFESVARHKRFIRAADELCLTHGAVSKQIKQLEEHYGVRLFDRTAAEVKLTNDGQRILGKVTEALNLIAESPNEIKENDTDGVIHLLVAPAFAAHWLIPRLSGFMQNHPGIRFQMETSPRAEDVYRDKFDLAIMLGDPSWPDRDVTLLSEIEVFPVCSPAVLAGNNPIRRPSDLRHHTLLHDDDGSLWSAWLASNRITNIDAYAGHMFPESIHLLIAAREGCGIALGDYVTSRHHLRSGTLVQPFSKTIRSPSSYYLITPDERRLPPRCSIFIEWLQTTLDGQS